MGDNYLKKIEIIPITNLPIIKEKDNLAIMIWEAAKKQETPIKNEDIIVITHVIISRSEGNVIDLNSIIPSKFAKNISKTTKKDPRLIEIILRESKGIVRMRDNKLITNTKQGIICANSGIDKSNVPGKNYVALLPKNPNKSAKKIREIILKIYKKNVAVIISDSHGRPLRQGEINIALGTSGLVPLWDRRGEKDLFGYTIKIKKTAIADELASAAELVIGQTDEAIPVAIIRGYAYPKSEVQNAEILIRDSKKDLFI
jgi:coenzyme F420-0:L-glutamate ligase/coenzyme F420-1:gamma-L-glutamate ligase